MIEYKLYNSVSKLPKTQWNDLTKHDLFLQTQYLEAFEKACPDTICIYYVGVFKLDKLIGIAIIQRVQLYLKDMFRHERVSCFKEFAQNAMSKVLKGNILVVGNLTHTGQHGIFFNQSEIQQADFLEKIFDACKELIKQIKTKKRKTIRLILFKDYFENDAIHLEQPVFQSKKFYKMKVQPNMIMRTRKEWLNESDYVSDMTTKYRTRFKRARQKRNHILVKELDLETLKSESEAIYELYMNVSNNAAFNTFILPKNHFLTLKQHLKENFRIFGYYLDNQLIGFYSLILNNKSLETYFLGYDSEHQHTNQLYLNMLYDMAYFAIKNKFNSVVYARTAMEIKSSVGAKPESMYMYLKLTNGFANAILKQVFMFMNPSQEWEERHPFKN
ncbi:GNAT family N-acetyltransferase [Gaetbulibacter sp. M235]|uniref:GNAT family N-acetyltransferase n=1 Tax=Gaetbulibacter sp. M235 TaxID=3126510 RepID=UPI00374F4D4D